MPVRRVPHPFYSVLTLEGVWRYSPCMGPGVKPCYRKWFEVISEFPTRFDTSQVEQPQKIVRGLCKNRLTYNGAHREALPHYYLAYC